MTVIAEKKEHVGTITINRPEVLNALDNETLHDFWRAWAGFGDDPIIEQEAMCLVRGHLSSTTGQ